MPAIEIKSYSREKDGIKKLSNNFCVSEFACKDGSDLILIAHDLVRLMQAIRSHFNAIVDINSGYRTAAYNKRVGGEPNSYHKKGMAADHNVGGLTPRQLYIAINSGKVPGVDPQKIGLGLYKSFVHIDCRGFRGRWSGAGVLLP